MSDSETIVIDLGSVRIDLAMERGFHPTGANISHVENSLREEKSARAEVVKLSFGLGAIHYSRSDLEKYKSKNQRVKVNAVGMFSLSSDVPPALALDVLESVKVLGIFRARQDVNAALTQAGRIL
jgi:hypothetical protein